MVRDLKLQMVLTVLSFLAFGPGLAHATQKVGTFIIGPLEQKFGDGRGRFAQTRKDRNHFMISCDAGAGRLAVAIGGYPSVGPLVQLEVSVAMDGKPLLTTTATTPPISDYEKAAARNGWAVAIGWEAKLAGSDKIIEALRGASSAAFHFTAPDKSE